MSLPRDEDTGRERFVLLLCFATYFAFLCFHVPRLNNYVLSDREFTGWSTPLAERVARGERPYADFVLPIPPGSFALLAVVQRLTGHVRLLQELWVAALAQALMGFVGYRIARLFGSKRVALLVALGSLVLLTQTPKECVYDHTALVVAWLAVLAGARASLSGEGAARKRLWIATGALSFAALAFKQSTAIGVGVGWALGIGYLALVDARDGARDALRDRARDFRAFGAGAALGVSVVLALLLALRASIPGFFRTVFLDGPRLKGGAMGLVKVFGSFAVFDDALLGTIVPLAVFFWIGRAVVVRHGSFHAGAAPAPGSLAPRAAMLIGLAGVATFVPAVVLLASGVRGLRQEVVAAADFLSKVPAYGIVIGAACFVAHFTEAMGAGAPHDDARRRGHALNATFIASFVCSMVHDASFVHFQAFYYNEPIIPLALLCLFFATERSGLRWATPLALLLSVFPAYGTKLNRALSADIPVRSGYWAGLRVNYRGAQILQAATRARDLAGPDGTVLVLPEDLELVGLVGSRRPKLRGAVVFVDQYPERLLADDLAELERNPPDVLVIHPHRRSDWEAVYRTWSEHSAAAMILNRALLRWIPERYVLDSTYPTVYLWDQGQLDVYVRADREAEP